MYLLSDLLLCLMLSTNFLVLEGQMTMFSEVQERAQSLTAVKIKMVPSHFQREGVKPYQVGSKGYMRVLVTNDSDQRIRVIIVDTYYQNRPKLFKDGQLLPYREEVKKLVRSKDEYPEFVRLGSVVFLQPHTSRDLEELNLSDWYGPLEPGSYRLINRHRLEINRPWTADSAELLFEVGPQKSSGNQTVQ